MSMVTESPAAETPNYVSKNEFITVTPEEAIARIRKAKAVQVFVNLSAGHRTLFTITRKEAIARLTWHTAARREKYGNTPVHITVTLMISPDGLICLICLGGDFS